MSNIQRNSSAEMHKNTDVQAGKEVEGSGKSSLSTSEIIWMGIGLIIGFPIVICLLVAGLMMDQKSEEQR